MSWFDDLKISKKLILGFSLVLVLGVMVGGFSITRLATVYAVSNEMATRTVPAMRAAGELDTYMSDWRAAEMELILASTPALRSEAEQGLTRAKQDMARAESTFFANAADSAMQRRMRDWTASFDAYQKVNEATLAAARAGRTADAVTLANGEEMKLFDASMLIIEEVANGERDKATAAQGTIRATYISARWWIMGMVLLSIVLGVAAALFVARKLSAGVELVAKRAMQLRMTCTTNLNNALEALARGDLNATAAYGTPKLNSAAQDEIGDLARTVDGMIDQSVAGIHAFTRTSATLRKVMGDTQGLIESAKEGKLAVRADATQYEGGYRDLVHGANQMLDAVVAPLTEASTTLQRIAARDLTARMEGAYANDLLVLKTALNSAVENLESALAEMAGSAEQVAAASGQIATGSQALAQGTSEQASSLEEVSASLQEMASMSKQNAGNATEARSLTEGARSTAANGVDSMRRLTDAINRIKTSSDSTARIVKTIDEIAFQTNLLALNAAVEAARAGDAGRGFAVVAEEVRNLAMRSAEAAKNTSTLIEESVQNAQNGVALNDEVLRNLQEIDAQVNKVGEVVAEIAAASEQQNQGVDQITVAIEQVNTVTQSAAANSEESAAASEELSGQAEQMRGLIGSFTIRGARAASRARVESVVPVVRPIASKAPSARPVVPVKVTVTAPVTAAAKRPVVRPAPRPALSGSAVGNGSGEGLFGSKGLAISAAEAAIPFNDESDEQTLAEF